MPCPSCGGGDGTNALCAYHYASSGILPRDTWSDENRIICDLIHRGKMPARLPESERSDYLIVADAC